MERSMKTKEKGITLVALVVTIVVLLILAGITINYVMGDNSVFKKASQSKLEYQISKAREQIEITFGHAKLLKHTDKKYNQDEYLDELMKKEISNIKIADDIVIVDGYAFEIDRSEPKIGEYIGKESELVFPKLTLNTVVADNHKTATITITAREETNGIYKIEVIQGGYVIKEYTYENEKEEIVEEFITKQNGEYTVKVYAALTEKEKTKVEGLVASVEYEPNGNDEYKKEHSTKVTVNEADEKAKSIKYQWLQTTAEPSESSFTTECTNGATITKDKVTGTWYLWTLLETESGKTNIGRSEGFNFDNQVPNITDFTATKYSETGITLSATAQDTNSGVIKFEFYVDNVLKGTETCKATTSSTTKSKTITGLSTGDHPCKVVVYDFANNSKEKSISGETKMYAWNKWSLVTTYSYTATKLNSWYCFTNCGHTQAGNIFVFNYQTGCYSAGQRKNVNGIGNLGLVMRNGEPKYVCITGYKNIDGFSVCTNGTVHNAQVDVTRKDSKGTTDYGKVYSNSSTTYPTNGSQGSYWYVKATSE